MDRIAFMKSVNFEFLRPGNELLANLAGLAEIEVKNKFSVGDSVELMTPQGNISLTIEQLENRKAEAVEAGLGSGHTVYLPVPKEVDLNHGILLRNLPQGQDTRNPHEAG